MFDQDYVMTQLRYTGIIETATIRKQGFSDRIPFREFVNRYKFIAYFENEDPPATPEVSRVKKSHLLRTFGYTAGVDLKIPDFYCNFQK